MKNPEIQTQSTASPLADDLLYGGAAIADERGETLRRTYYLLLTGQIPAFKLGGRWYARRSSLRAQIERLEREAGDE